MATNTYIPRIKQLYDTQAKQKIAASLKIDNPMRVPALEKIVVSCGLGRAQEDKRAMEVATNTLAKITGQAPMQTKARKSIAAFALREGSVIGLKVTLRGKRMYEFFDRLVSIVLPRLRDFHGVSVKSFDPSGNYTIGFADQSVFPELSFEETSYLHGLEVTIVTTAKDKPEGLALLSELGMPFEKAKEVTSG